jgi:hypothetical protein
MKTPALATASGGLAESVTGKLAGASGRMGVTTGMLPLTDSSFICEAGTAVTSNVWQGVSPGSVHALICAPLVIELTCTGSSMHIRYFRSWAWSRSGILIK